MDSEPGLESLMRAYQEGDLTAATALVERLSPPLRGFFAVQVTSRTEADDLLQETWLRVHEVRHTYRAGAPVLPWLYAIARHIRVDHFRKTIRQQSQARLYVREAGAVTLASSGKPERTDLRALLGSLPDSQREVVAMLKVADMSIEEVARATGSSIGSVKQKAHRAYEKLRQHFEKLGKGQASMGGQR